MHSIPPPGPIVLFGSGETSPSGRKVFDFIFQNLPERPRVALLETPAGFEVNSERVIGRVGEFISYHLQNYQPQIETVPAKKRGTAFSPDDEAIAAQLLDADLIFMGPGSPTYAVRQLDQSVVWHTLLARHRLGTALVLASAAAIAISAYALPVYEIYKVGEDLHWKKGLNLFETYGLPLVFVPHWNNQDGGEELDTSRCFMGEERFSALMSQLPDDLTVLGIDEKTALILDIQAEEARVMGLGGVTLIHTGHVHKGDGIRQDDTSLQKIADARHGHIHYYPGGSHFPLHECCPIKIPYTVEGIPAQVWQQAYLNSEQVNEPPGNNKEMPSSEVLELVQARQQARAERNWSLSDELRVQIAALGWQVKDTPQGPQVEKIG